MKLVFLDAATMGDDIDLSPFEQFGTLTVYYNTTPAEVVPRIATADIVLVNKVKINKEAMQAAKELKLICVAATGMDVIDLQYAAKAGIPVMNVAGYSTDSVAQTTFLHILSCMQQGPYFNEFAHSQAYSKSGLPTHFGGRYFHELSGKRMGIIGMGAIGRKVAAIASAFGMDVVYYSSSGKDRSDGQYRRVNLDELLRTSDVVSIHSPLNEKTRGLIGKVELEKMKASAYLFNLGRGAIVDECALADALNENRLAGAGMDVFSTEPLPADHCYRKVTDKSKLFLTPHIGWASVEARKRLVSMMVDNINQYIASRSGDRSRAEK
ncbi:MAG: Glycerate dehydrogenase [Bacteroidetes bacterium ADurb.Bin037]|nr:MAG: Glycerate dehydrogenase [Bacteroidetes bacterium ADurb.Bin037]HPW78425.1 D-2-hydroxyacid dehydrogenase [Bacteroidales bacterium]HQB55947.1 D-2-hydroxyacid dehydrogenase [Bacteroidales bacterium]